jgi:hypothetical protein
MVINFPSFVEGNFLSIRLFASQVSLLHGVNWFIRDIFVSRVHTRVSKQSAVGVQDNDVTLTEQRDSNLLIPL